MFANGFVFDDLPLELVKEAAHVASEAGAAICFDPGRWPRGGVLLAVQTSRSGACLPSEETVSSRTAPSIVP